MPAASPFAPHDAIASLRGLHRFAEVLTRPYSLDELAWELADHIGKLLGFEDCVIYLRQGEVLVQAAAYGVKAKNRHIVEPIVIPVGEGIVGTVAATGRIEYVPDIREDDRYIPDQYRGTSELAVPIVFEGNVIGVLDSEDKGVDAYSQHDQALFELVALMAASRFAWLSLERQRLRDEGRRQRDRTEALGRLAGGVAHDFNNLLGVMALNVDLMEDANPIEAQAALAATREAIERARGLTSQLSTFATGSGLLRDVVDAQTLVEEMVQEAREQRRLTVSLDVPGELPALNADRVQLGQALRNLIRYFGHTAAGQARLSLDGQIEPEHLVFRIHSNGPAIPTAALEHLFDPYSSVEGGLELANAFWIITRHGGTLEAESVEDQGTTFTVRLPALPGRAAAPERRMEARRELRILVVDDEPALLRAVKTLLERMGHQVVACTEGWNAVQRWRRSRDTEPFDVAILDLTHPSGQGGLETFRQLRDLDPDTTAIVMSGYTDDDAMVDFREHGFAARLEKPFQRSSLEKALRDSVPH